MRWRGPHRAAVEEALGDEGRFDGGQRQADAACAAAHTARYGSLAAPLYRQMLAASEAAEGEWGEGAEEGGEDAAAG